MTCDVEIKHPENVIIKNILILCKGSKRKINNDKLFPDTEHLHFQAQLAMHIHTISSSADTKGLLHKTVELR